MAAGELIEQFTGHEDRVSRFIDKWRNKPDLVALARIYLRQLQDIEDAAFEVLLERDLDNAEGVQLETIGKLVGQPRTTSNDERYRTAIRARIAINLSDSTGEDIIRVANLLLVDAEDFELRDEPPAQLRVTITDPLTSADSDLVHSLLDEADAAGVRLLLQWEALPTSFAFEVSEPEADGTIALPDGLVYECATANTTARVDADTIRTGFAINAFRGFSLDGTTWTALVEKATTNLVYDLDLNNWLVIGSVTPGVAIGPDGNLIVCEIEDNSTVEAERLRLSGITLALGQPYTASGWINVVTLSAGDSRFGYNQTPNPDAWVQRFAPTGGWEYGQATEVSTNTSCEFNLFPALSGVTPTGISRYAFLQLELGSYATSHIDGSRVAGVFRYIHGRAITKSGYFSGSVTFQPHFADTNAGLTDFHVCWLSNDVRVTYDAGAKTFRLWISGVVVHTSDAVTFNAFDIVTVSFASLTTGTSLSTSGFATGDSTKTSATVQPVVAAVDDIYILGGPSGASEGFGFSAVSFDQEDLPKLTLGSTVGTPTSGGGLGSTTSGSTNPGKLSSVIGPEG